MAHAQHPMRLSINGVDITAHVTNIEVRHTAPVAARAFIVRFRNDVARHELQKDWWGPVDWLEYGYDYLDGEVNGWKAAAPDFHRGNFASFKDAQCPLECDEKDPDEGGYHAVGTPRYSELGRLTRDDYDATEIMWHLEGRSCPA